MTGYIDTPTIGEILQEEFMEPMDISAYKLAQEMDITLVPYENERGMDATRELISGIKKGQSSTHDLTFESVQYVCRILERIYNDPILSECLRETTE